MTGAGGDQGVVFRVVDALDNPLGGRIVRLRVASGQPTVKRLRGAILEASSPGGANRQAVRVRGFSLIGGRPSDQRIVQTGRVDLVIDDPAPDGQPVDVGWDLRLPPS